MFDFEKLDVYTQARTYARQILYFLFQENPDIDPYLQDQLKRSSVSIPLNIAEGAGRMTPADKRRFYTMARSSLFESVATLHILLDVGKMSESQYQELYDTSETLSKMLLGLIRSQ